MHFIATQEPFVLDIQECYVGLKSNDHGSIFCEKIDDYPLTTSRLQMVP